MNDTIAGDQPEGDPGEAVPEDPGRVIEGMSTHAIFTLDSDGCIATWPGPAQELYGYDQASVLGSDVGVLFAEEHSADRSVEEILAEAREGAVESESWHACSGGSVFWATMALSALGDDAGGYAVVSHDTTAKKQYERMLERQNDRLKEFTDILAHDLRNPLNLIDQLLVLYKETGEEDHIESIEETTDRMERLVDDLLRVARQGSVVTDPEATDIAEVIDTAWRATGDLSEGATLEYEAVPSVSADGDRLCELFENLFRNAVEHGSTRNRTSSDDAVEHAGESVTVRVGPLSEGIYVEDDGPGIPPDRREEVFDHGVTTAEDGSGYGLSVVRTIASAHGWDVVATEAPGGGARFEVTGIEFLE